MTAAIIAILCLIAVMLLRGVFAMSDTITRNREATKSVRRAYQDTRLFRLRTRTRL